VSVPTLDQLYELAGHLAELDFLSQPAATQPAAAESVAPGDVSVETAPQPSPNGDDRPATDRQINCLNDLASKAGWELHVFEKRVASLYDLADFAKLTKQMASELITRLQNNDLNPELLG
jgi:hypothetical protein